MIHTDMLRHIDILSDMRVVTRYAIRRVTSWLRRAILREDNTLLRLLLHDISALRQKKSG